MKKLEFSIEINSPKEKVWDALWKDENYSQWTSVFSPGSYAEFDFVEGSKFRFMSPENHGVWGVIQKLVPFETIHFLHKGEVHNGEEQPEKYDDDAIENYDLTEKNGVTTLVSTLKTTEEYLDFFVQVLPKAMQKIKEIAEK